RGGGVGFVGKWSVQQAGWSFPLPSSLWDAAGTTNLFSEAGSETGSALFRHWVGGQMALARDFAWFYAPYVNSYKRYQAGSFAPTRIAWAFDNRTTGFRVCGAGSALRVENRVPGAGANTPRAFAATIAAGLYGIERKLDPGPLYRGN